MVEIDHGVSRLGGELVSHYTTDARLWDESSSQFENDYRATSTFAVWFRDPRHTTKMHFIYSRSFSESDDG